MEMELVLVSILGYKIFILNFFLLFQDVQKLFEDMEILKPTILPGVPRLFSRMFQKVMAGKDQKGGISKFLFDLGYSSKQAILEEGNKK